MTDRSGRRARWSALLVVAPGAAALFGATTSWALHTTPATATSAAVTPHQVTAPARPAPRVIDARPALTALARRAAANEHQVAALRTQLAQLRKQLSSLTVPVVAAGPAYTGSSGGSGGGSAAAPVQAQGAPAAAAPAPAAAAPAPAPAAAAPAPAPAPVAAAPPPAQTTTGASGAVK